MVTQIVKPKHLLYVAVDGVAPRAKMNQQRSRRFRAERDQREANKEAIASAKVESRSDLFDSNCITPGTEFMENVSKHIQWFLRKKIKEDPLWNHLRVIYSGPEVPGEGEHKIMQFIRDQRSNPN